MSKREDVSAVRLSKEGSEGDEGEQMGRVSPTWPVWMPPCVCDVAALDGQSGSHASSSLVRRLEADAAARIAVPRTGDTGSPRAGV